MRRFTRENRTTSVQNVTTASRAPTQAQLPAVGPNEDFAKCPRRVEYQKQTILCEYSKLVKRMNFPHIAQLHRYVAKQQPLRC